MATRIGTSGPDNIMGTADNDTIQTLGGDDLASGNQGDDRIEGGAGNDDLSGNEGVDIILGGTGNDRLSGGQGNDSLTGETGNDTLVGGLDNDALRGGDGQDNFAVSLGDGDDTVLDFAKGQDTITLAGFSGFQAFQQLEIQVANTDSLVILSEDQGIRVTNVTNLDAGDFTFEEVQYQVTSLQPESFPDVAPPGAMITPGLEPVDLAEPQQIDDMLMV